ncbi:MAG TPA: Gp49 family protein [Pseudoxanthomonas mexicana]|nr:Gp49 family protein [Pseudoxanthomonas mexicana]
MDRAQTIEQEIQAKGLDAPRVRPADIEAEIASEHYFTAFDGALAAASEEHDSAEAAVRIALGMPQQLQLLTFCVLVLRNGFTVTGESACASPENFDAEIGRKVARQNATEKLWPLLGFRLRDQLAKAG